MWTDLSPGSGFTRAPTNTGTHAGNLWSSTGTLLASVTFIGETASGWQQADFATPVAITANTTYVASYHTNVGNYAYNQSYFASGVTSGALTALANGADGGNGVYRYGATNAFPDQTWNANNYWVDVVFTTSGGGPDATPPTVTTFTLPRHGDDPHRPHHRASPPRITSRSPAIW